MGSSIVKLFIAWQIKANGTWLFQSIYNDTNLQGNNTNIIPIEEMSQKNYDFCVG